MPCALASVAAAVRSLVWLRLRGGGWLPLAYASESGFAGLGIYVLLWIFALPLMVIACVFVGIARWASDD